MYEHFNICICIYKLIVEGRARIHLIYVYNVIGDCRGEGDFEHAGMEFRYIYIYLIGLELQMVYCCLSH